MHGKDFARLTCEGNQSSTPNKYYPSMDDDSNKLDSYLVRAKRWDRPPPSPPIQPAQIRPSSSVTAWGGWGWLGGGRGR